MENIPEEIWMIVCSYLDFPTLFNGLGKTCRRFHRLVRDPIIRRNVKGLSLKQTKTLAGDVICLTVRGERSVPSEISFPKVKTLTIDECLSSVATELISRCPRLQRLRLNHMSGDVTFASTLKELTVENVNLCIKGRLPQLEKMIIRNSSISFHKFRAQILNSLSLQKSKLNNSIPVDEIYVDRPTQLVKHKIFPKKRIFAQKITAIENALIRKKGICVTYDQMVEYHGPYFVDDAFTKYAFQDDSHPLPYRDLKNVSLRTAVYLSRLGKLSKCKLCVLYSSSCSEQPENMPELKTLVLRGDFASGTLRQFLWNCPKLDTLCMSFYDESVLVGNGSTKIKKLNLTCGTEPVDISKISNKFPNVVHLKISRVPYVWNSELVFLRKLKKLNIEMTRVRCRDIFVSSMCRFQPESLKNRVKIIH